MKTFVRMINLGVVVIVVLFALLLNVARITSLFAPQFVDSINHQLESDEITLSGLTVRWSGFNPIVKLESLRHPNFSINGMKVEIDLFRSIWKNHIVLGVLQIDTIDIQPPQDFRNCAISFQSDQDLGSAMVAVLMESSMVDIQFRSSLRCMEREYKHIGTLQKRSTGDSFDVNIEVHQIGSCADCGVQLSFKQHNSGLLFSHTTNEFDLVVNEFSILPSFFGFDIVQDVLVDTELRWRLDTGNGGGHATFTINPTEPKEPAKLVSIAGEIRANCRSDRCQGEISSYLQHHRLDQRTAVPEISFEYDSHDKKFFGSSSAIPVNLVSLILEVFSKSDSDLNQWMRGLEPKGNIHQVHALVDQKGLSYRASIDDFLLSNFRQVPMIAAARVDLMGFNNVHIFNLVESQLDVALQEWFTDPWLFIKGNLSGLIEYRNGVFALSTEGEAISHDGESVSIDFGLRNELWRSAYTFGSVVTMKSTAVNQLSTYLPTNLPKQASQYIQDSLKQGTLFDIECVMYSSNRNSFRSRVFDYGIVSSFRYVNMRYLSDWPQLSNAHGTVWLNQDALTVRIQQGDVSANAVVSSEIYLPLKTSNVHVLLQSTTTADSLLAFLTSIQLYDSDSFHWSDFSGTGSVTVDANINIPIGEGNQEALTFDITSTLIDTTLSHQPSKLTLTNLSGDVHYRYPAQLSSGLVSGRFLDRPITLQVRQLEDIWDSKITHVDFTTVLTPDTITHFLGSGLRTFVDGEAELRGYFEVNTQVDPSSRIVLESDLRGLSVHLPLPAGKGKDNLKPTTATVLLFKNPVYEINSGELSAKVTTAAGTLKGQIAFDMNPADLELAESNWVIGGQISQLDLVSWPQIGSEAGVFPDLRIQDLRIDQVQSTGWSMSNTTVSGVMRENSVQLSVNSDEIAAVLSKEPDERLNLKISKLHLHSREKDSSTPSDYITFVDRLPSLDIVIDELLYTDDDGDQVDLGIWSGSLDIEDQMVIVSDLQAQLNGIGIKSSAGHHETLVWDTDLGSTTFDGILFGENLIDSLYWFKMEGEVESESFEIQTDIEWVGTPFDLKPQQFQGIVEVDIERGRFVEAGVGSGARRITSLLNIAPIIQKLRVDFRNLFQEGFVFDRVFLKAYVDHSVVNVTNEFPFEVESRSSDILFSGTINFDSQSVLGEIVVRLPLTSSLPFYVAIATGNPTLVLGTWLGKTVFEEQIDRISSHKYKISGTINKPIVEFVGLFSDELSDVKHNTSTNKSESSEKEEDR